MIHYAVWTWYTKVLDMHDTSHIPYTHKPKDRQWPADPCATIRSLLDHGADLHAQTTSGYTILDGMCLNLIQFDGSARPRDTRAFGFGTWLERLRDLDFNIREYIRREKTLHDGVLHDLGLGLSMEIRFREDPSPWAWSVFQGPEERERGEFVNHITECYIWPEWESKFATPKPPPPLPPTILVRPHPMVVLQRLDGLEDASETGPQEIIVDFPRSFEHLHSYFHMICWKVRRYAVMGARYRVEFSAYFAAVISLLGFGYFARIWTTWIFYTSLKIAGYAASC
jgi:hypothetical protein